MGRVSYEDALARQEALVQARIATPGALPDVLLLLEHDPVYTIGRTPDRSSLVPAVPAGSPTAAAPPLLPHPVVTTNRGGQATYHGPGQLVGYPIVDLQRRGRDLHRYLRTLEDVVVTAAGQHGVAAGRRPGLTGVWIPAGADDGSPDPRAGREPAAPAPARKLASIGVGVRRWVTMHGFAVNVEAISLPPFAAITPCGLGGVAMTCLERERPPGSAPVATRRFADTVAGAFRAAFERPGS